MYCIFIAHYALAPTVGVLADLVLEVQGNMPKLIYRIFKKYRWYVAVLHSFRIWGEVFSLDILLRLHGLSKEAPKIPISFHKVFIQNALFVYM